MYDSHCCCFSFQDNELIGSIPLDYDLCVKVVDDPRTPVSADHMTTPTYHMTLSLQHCFEIFSSTGVIKAWKKDSDGKVVKGKIKYKRYYLFSVYSLSLLPFFPLSSSLLASLFLSFLHLPSLSFSPPSLPTLSLLPPLCLSSPSPLPPPLPLPTLSLSLPLSLLSLSLSLSPSLSSLQVTMITTDCKRCRTRKETHGSPALTVSFVTALCSIPYNRKREKLLESRAWIFPNSTKKNIMVLKKKRPLPNIE